MSTFPIRRLEEEELLLSAVMRDDPDKIRELASKHGAALLNSQLVAKQRGSTALWHAVMARRMNALRALAGCHGVNLNTLDMSFETPLAKAIWDVDMVRTLLDAGADVNRADIQGITPLMRAAAENQTEVVDLLLQRGARADMHDNANKQAKHYAIGRFACEALALLLRHEGKQEAEIIPALAQLMKDEDEETKPEKRGRREREESTQGGGGDDQMGQKLKRRRTGSGADRTGECEQ